MFKKYHLYILAFAFFVLLLVSDAFTHSSYNQRSQQQLENCLERREQDKLPSDDCFTTANAAQTAFSSATSSHILTFLVIVLLVSQLSGRINQLEDQIKKIETQKNV